MIHYDHHHHHHQRYHGLSSFTSAFTFTSVVFLIALWIFFWFWFWFYFLLRDTANYRIPWDCSVDMIWRRQQKQNMLCKMPTYGRSHAIQIQFEFQSPIMGQIAARISISKDCGFVVFGLYKILSVKHKMESYLISHNKA